MSNIISKLFGYEFIVSPKLHSHPITTHHPSALCFTAPCLSPKIFFFFSESENNPRGSLLQALYFLYCPHSDHLFLAFCFSVFLFLIHQGKKAAAVVGNFPTFFSTKPQPQASQKFRVCFQLSSVTIFWKVLLFGGFF